MLSRCSKCDFYMKGVRNKKNSERSWFNRPRSKLSRSVFLWSVLYKNRVSMSHILMVCTCVFFCRMLLFFYGYLCILRNRSLSKQQGTDCEWNFLYGIVKRWERSWNLIYVCTEFVKYFFKLKENLFFF